MKIFQNRKIRKIFKIEKSRFSLKIFENRKIRKSKFLSFQNFWSKFQNRFSTKNFQYFSMNFFLNRFYFFPSFIISRLEIARRPEGCVRLIIVKSKKATFFQFLTILEGYGIWDLGICTIRVADWAFGDIRVPRLEYEV